MAQTHSCGCQLGRPQQKPCPEGAALWQAAKEAYAEALSTGDWRPVAEARRAVYAHYGQVPWACDAYVSNMDLDTFNRLQFTGQMEKWIETGDELAPHARICWGLRFSKDYPER